MDKSKAYILSVGSAMGQWMLLGFAVVLFLLALPTLFGGDNPAFGLLWALGLTAIISPSWIWPVHTMYLDAEGFRIEALLRPSVFYPTDEFVRARISNAFTTYKIYLLFKDGRQYKVVLKLGFGQEVKLVLLDGPPFVETRKAANKHVRDAIAAQQSS